MGGDAMSVDFSVEPFGQAAGDFNEWTMFVQSPTIDRAPRGERAFRRGHEYVVVRERDRVAMWGMQAGGFDYPGRPSVAAGAEPGCGGGRHNGRTVRVRANLMDVAINVDRGLPGYATIHRSRDTADMDIGEEHGSVRSCGYGTDPEGRSDALAVYYGRACVPLVASGDFVEAAELLDLSGRADAQDVGIVGPDVDDVAGGHTTRYTTSEIRLRSGDRAPYAVGRATVK